MKRHAAILIVILLAGTTTAAETVSIEASRDATMIQHPDGALANGAGPALFAGRNNQDENSIRRALVHFDIAGVVPRPAIIQDVRLVLYLTPSNTGPREIRVHRVLADWSEGASSSSGGGGDDAGPGDVTWIHRTYDTDFWTISGGQFVGHPSAALDVSDPGYFTWEGRGLTRDVRIWQAAPQINFGWVLIGDETTRQSAQRFASREEPDPALRPVLEVTYRRPGRR